MYTRHIGRGPEIGGWRLPSRSLGRHPHSITAHLINLQMESASWSNSNSAPTTPESTSGGELDPLQASPARVGGQPQEMLDSPPSDVERLPDVDIDEGAVMEEGEVAVSTGLPYRPSCLSRPCDIDRNHCAGDDRRTTLPLKRSTQLSHLPAATSIPISRFRPLHHLREKEKVEHQPTLRLGGIRRFRRRPPLAGRRSHCLTRHSWKAGTRVRLHPFGVLC
jgi:hypothetical protein